MNIEMKTNALPVLDFDLDLQKKSITNINIYNELMFKIYFEEKKDAIITFDKIHSLLKKYMGGNKKIEDYISHIEKFGFYTPYKPNLRIYIKKSK